MSIKAIHIRTYIAIYYLDSIHEVVGLLAICYKDNSYISIINVRYGIPNDDLITTPIEG